MRALSCVLFCASWLCAAAATAATTLGCRDDQSGATIKVTVDVDARTVRWDIPQTDEVLEYVDGEQRGICLEKCGLLGTLMGGDAKAMNFVKVSREVIEFGVLGGKSPTWKLDREVKTLVSDSTWFDTFKCEIVKPF